MARRASRVIRWVLIAIACALVFLIPSSYIAARGGPGWLSAVVGALAFPLLPGGWHVIAERRRKRRLAAVAAASKTPVRAKPAGLTGGDRLAMRAAAVALVAVAPLVAFDRGRVWAGVRHHATWFVPSEPARFAYGFAAPLVKQVPGDAELVVIARDHPIRLIDPGTSMHGAMVSAMKGSDYLLAVPAQGETRTMVEGVATELKSTMLGGFLGDAFAGAAMTVRGEAAVFTTSAWGTTPGTGPGARLRALIGEVPAHALIAVAIAPVAPREDIREGVAWAGQSGGTIQIRARLEMADPPAAEKLVALGKAKIAEASTAPVCATGFAALAGGVAIDRDVATVRVRVDVPVGKLRALVTCMKPAKP